MSLTGLIAAAAFVSGATSIASAGQATSTPAAPGTWVDQPLPGMSLPFGPVPVTIHAADPAGIETISLLADGQLAATLPAPAGDLVTVAWTWHPVSPGTHVLTVRATAVDGMTSAPVSLGVTFLGSGIAPTASPIVSPSPPATTQPSMTQPTPTRSPRPSASLAPCLPTAPDLFGPTDGSTTYASSGGDKPVFWWGYHFRPTCAATSFQLKVSAKSDLSSPLFVPLVLASSGTGYSWTWVPPSPLPFARSCTRYYWTVTSLEASGSPGGTAPTWSFEICP